MKQAVTQLLQLASNGDVTARETVLTRLYGDLRDLAAAQMARQDGQHTLQPTALVHEAYLRLVQIEDTSFESRRQFFALASRVMRGVLVDYARARGALKRGGEHERASVEVETLALDAAAGPVDLLELGFALEDLAALDDQLAHLCELRYLGGLTVQEIAETIEVPLRTVERRLQVANAWLRDRFAP